MHILCRWVCETEINNPQIAFKKQKRKAEKKLRKRNKRVSGTYTKLSGNSMVVHSYTTLFIHYPVQPSNIHQLEYLKKKNVENLKVLYASHIYTLFFYNTFLVLPLSFQRYQRLLYVRYVWKSTQIYFYAICFNVKSIPYSENIFVYLKHQGK